MGVHSYHGATVSCDGCGVMVVDALSECATQMEAVATARDFGATVNRGVVTCSHCRRKKLVDGGEHRG